MREWAELMASLVAEEMAGGLEEDAKAWFLDLE